MNRQEIITVLKAAANPRVVGVNFGDAQSAAKNGLREYFGLNQEISAREIKGRQNEIFAIIEEIVDEVVPQAVIDRTGDFAEIVTIGRNDKATFRVPTTEASKQRMRKAIKEGARGGIYKAYRVDGNNFDIKTTVNSVGYAITLEELLTGRRTIAELVNLLADAWTEKIYMQTFKMLQAAAAQAPAINKVTNGTTTIENAKLDKVIGIVKAYGRPVILGFAQHLAMLGNNVIAGNNTLRPEGDLNDVRNQGYIGTYKGVPVVELPNYIVNHGNDKITWAFNENKILILPADEKPVKVVFQGESYTAEVVQPHGGLEFHNHRIMGMTVVFNNYIASYELTDIWA